MVTEIGNWKEEEDAETGQGPAQTCKQYLKESWKMFQLSSWFIALACSPLSGWRKKAGGSESRHVTVTARTHGTQPSQISCTGNVDRVLAHEGRPVRVTFKIPYRLGF